MRRSPNISGTGFAAFKNSIETLVLTGNPLTPEGLAAIGKMPGLKHLNLGNCELTASHYENLAAAKLETLILGQVTGVEVGLKQVARIGGLKELRLFNVDATAKAFSELANAKTLETLELKQVTKLTAAEVRSLAQALPRVRIESDFGAFGPKDK